MTSYQYRKSHRGDKTILRPSYLHHGISYSGKMTSLYWIGAQAINNYYTNSIATVMQCKPYHVKVMKRYFSNHQPHHCLLSRLFGHRSKKTSKLRVTGHCAGNSPGTGEFPAQMASNAENISIWWRHHEYSHSNITVRAVKLFKYLELISQTVHELRINIMWKSSS